MQLENVWTGRQKTFDVWELLGAGAIGYAGGVVADVLEPAVHSWHRGFFLSISAGGFLTLPLWVRRKRTSMRDRLWAAFVGSHISHLILDSQTPRGLPWIDPKIDTFAGLKSLSFSK
jgi:membrane-bound metal-dependent hydrolase YbcI (DUF457 family)